MKIFKSAIVSILLFSGQFSFDCAGQSFKAISVDAPFDLSDLKEFVFPTREFSIKDYGASANDVVKNTKAFAKAISACHKAGGGYVVVPPGEWITGPVHFKSNVNLHLSEGAVLRFTDNPDNYLPAVPTSWEGMECYNYSPLIYAYDCENIAISGTGTIAPIMDTWKKWFRRPEPHITALKNLYTMASTDVSIEERQMAHGENHLRPHLIHFNRCKNVLLDGFKIRESPFWTIHLFLCDGGIARNLDVKAHGHNNDGIDLEMSRNILVENCTFDQGDDGIVIKSGRNQDAWRLNQPCENIVVRNCIVNKGHVLLGIGSEMSAGVRNVYMTDCKVTDNVFRLLFIKTNHRRGGFIENITMNNVTAQSMQRVLEVDTDVLYQWRDIVPTYCDSITRINGIHMDNIKCDHADAVYELKGDARLPIRDVNLRNITVSNVTDFVSKASNTEGIKVSNLNYSKQNQSK